ncbi:putative remodeling and spacing factor 1 isoform X1 [Apostichopus japonicus]|uniref:Putative remodeling and spacing factor 1 isoform X1 n=1 Tax=Stichopus japonicus TaxID=307972 RepID=A0A2G8KKN0_STIJA|nr:putative remodeling and spacing factor 1 isoform X1 [Apostichopus japonicus]
MATLSVRNHPNFAVICSFLDRYGEQLRLPDLTIPELEEVLEDTKSVGHGLKELIITLMKRVVNSIKPDRWEKHLIKLIDNYHSPVDAWELQSLGFSLCKLETKLSILKYLCETQFDDNPKFKNLVNKEIPDEQKLKPIGRDKSGLVYWFQKDHDCNIRIYREEQDDNDESTWQRVGRNREDLANLISELKVSQGMLFNPDSLESSRSATPVLTNGEAKHGVVKQEATDGKVDSESSSLVKSEDIADTRQHQTEPGILSAGTVKLEDVKIEVEKPLSGKYEHDKNSIQSEEKSSLQQNECKEEDKSIPQEKEKKTLKDVDSTSTGEAETPPQDDKPEVKSDQLMETKSHSKVANISGDDHRKVTVKSEEGSAVQREENSDSDGLVIDEKEGKTGDREEQEIKEEASTDDDLNNKSALENQGRSKDQKEQLDDKCTEQKVLADEIRTEEKEGVDGGKSKEKESEGKKVERLRDSKDNKGNIEGGKDDRKESDRVSKESGEERNEEPGKAETEDRETHSTDDRTEAGKGGEEKETEERPENVSEEPDSTPKETEKSTPVDEASENKETLQVEVAAKDVRKKDKRGVRRKAVETVEGDGKEVRWSRRLRERKPPPPPPTKEEPVVEETPKKKQKMGKKDDVKVGKHSGRKRKKREESDKEEEEKEEEEKEEEEIDEIEEKDNSSDEDFTLKKATTKNSSNEVAAPVQKARTATSKKKSKSHSKKMEPEPELSDEPCIKCGNYNHPHQILLCDSCDAGYHTACLRPPLMYVPDGEWFCPACEHVTLLKRLEETLEVVDGELKVMEQKNRKKQIKFKWLLTEVCPANILPVESLVLVTKRIEKAEQPERQRHERTRPKPKKAARTYVEEPDEIEYIQRRSGRNRKQINYKFEEFDTAINSAISEEVEEKKKAIAQGAHVVYGQSRGKDMSTIEAAHWEEQEMKEKERNARKKRKKLLSNLDDSSEEEEEDESDEFKIKDKDSNRLSSLFMHVEYPVRVVQKMIFWQKMKRPLQQKKRRRKEEEFSGKSDSGSEYGRKRKKGSKKRKARGRRRDKGPVRRSSRHLGKERKLYLDTSSSSESDEGRPRDAWRMNPIITARRQIVNSEDESDRKRKRVDQSSSESGGDPSFGKGRKNGSHHRSRSVSPDEHREKKKKKKKQKWKEESSSTEDEEDGFVQPKRKFRIDSDDSGDSEGGGKSEEIVGGGSEGTVNYRKMAEGSSSEDGAGGKSGDSEMEEGKRKDALSGDPISGDEDDDEWEGAERKVEKSEKIEEMDVAEKVRAGAKLNQNNSALVNDDDGLPPITDLEDLKENSSLQSQKVEAVALAMVKTDRKSAEDDDELEGVTDIFDYLSKD